MLPDSIWLLNHPTTQIKFSYQKFIHIHEEFSTTNYMIWALITVNHSIQQAIENRQHQQQFVSVNGARSKICFDFNIRCPCVK